MTLQELADFLDVKSVGSLRTQVRRGALAATRAGNQWMVSEEEAERYRAVHRAGAGRRGRPPKPPSRGQDDRPGHGEPGKGE